MAFWDRLFKRKEPQAPVDMIGQHLVVIEQGEPDEQIASLIAIRVISIRKDPIYDPRIVPTLIGVLNSDAPYEVREAALAGFSFCKSESDTQITIPYLISLMRDPNDPLQAHAAIVLGNMGVFRAIEELKEAATNNNPELRANTVWALGHLITISIQKCDNPVAMCDVIIAALKDPDVAVRREAAGALNGINYPGAIELLIPILKDSDAEVREKIARGLRGYHDNSVIENLITALSDSHPDVRISAAQSLGSISNSRAVLPLIALLGDKNADVRKHSKEALERIKTTMEQPGIDYPLNSAPSELSFINHVLTLSESPSSANIAFNTLMEHGIITAPILTQKLSKLATPLSVAVVTLRKEGRTLLRSSQPEETSPDILLRPAQGGRKTEPSQLLRQDPGEGQRR
jgi:HEAT repeat protein